MRPITFTYPIPSVNAVSATQTTTATSQSVLINGSLSNIGAGQTPITAVAGAGIQRTVTITSTGNISTSTFTISGYDLRATGLLSTSIAGPNAATATTTTEFYRVVSISVGTLASSSFTTGFGATGQTNWVRADTFQVPINLSAMISTVTSCPVSIQHAFDPVDTASPTWFTATGMSGVTTTTNSTFDEVATFWKAIFLATSTATGSSSVIFAQAGY